MRRLALAVDGRTVMGQSLPDEIRKQWSARVRSLDDGSSSLIRVVTDPAEADWLVQVAALERTDIVYLVPAERNGAPVDDELLRMIPPGESVIASLKSELEHVARYGKLSQVTEEQTSQNESHVEPEVEGRPESSRSQSSQNADADLVARDQAIEDMEKERQSREKLREELEKKEADERVGITGAVFGIARHGPAEDLKAEIVEEQSGIYHTPNRTQAVLGTYGKMVEGNRLLGHLDRFEDRGLVRQLERVRRIITVQRVGRGTSKDFVSFFGNRQAWQIVDLALHVSGGRHQEVAFEISGVRLDQNDVIKALNADDDALGYFDYLLKHKQRPCLVLENVVFTSYSVASDSDLDLGGKGKTVLTSDGIEARVGGQHGSFMQLTSPVIRCYQAYEVKRDGRQIVELVNIEP